MPPFGHTSVPSAALASATLHPDERAAPAALVEVVRALDDMAWLADDGGILVFANAAFAAGTLTPLDSAVGSGAFDALYGPLTTEDARAAVAAAIRERRRLRLELDLVRRDGKLLRAALHLDAIADGARCWFLCVLKDLTDQHASAAMMARARDVIEAVAHGAPGVVYQVRADARGRRRYGFVSEGCRQVLGFDASEVTAGAGDRILAAVPDEDRDGLLASIERSRHTLEPWRHTFRCEVQGEHRWIRGASLPVRLANGDTVWNGMLIDVTDEMRARAAAGAALERAGTADRSKAECLAAVGHELRTPLHAVIGFAEVFQDELHGPLGDPRYRLHADVIRSNGRRLLDMVDSVLEFARIESGGLQLDEAEVPVRMLVEPCIEALAGQLEARDLRIVDRLGDRRHRLVVDRLQMRRVLSHLLSNAATFTPAGGSVTIDLVDAADGGVAIGITDTGVGIAPEDLARAFEPFVRLDGALSRRYEGLGLGLPLARALVESHGGRLSLEPAAGGGTCARAHLPARRVLRG